MNETDLEKVRKIFMAAFKLEEVINETEVSSKNTFSWDSLNFINLVFSLEEQFNIVFSDQELIEMNSFEEIVKIMEAKLS